MKIGIGNDHAAVTMKNEISDYLKELGHEVVNYGTDEDASCSYAVYGEKVARAVAAKEVDLGVLICQDHQIRPAVCPGSTHPHPKAVLKDTPGH